LTSGLHDAVIRDDVAGVRQAVVSGTDPDLIDPSLGTPLALAAELGHRDAVLALIALGADVKQPDAVGRARGSGHPDIAALLEAKQASPRNAR
jgi:hypothetical protein